MGRAVNTLLPVASIGGEVVKARVLVLWGLDGGFPFVTPKCFKHLRLSFSHVLYFGGWLKRLAGEVFNRLETYSMYCRSAEIQRNQL